MRAHVKIEFPCGYKYEIDILTGLFEAGNFSIENSRIKECPLHGKYCPPEKLK